MQSNEIAEKAPARGSPIRIGKTHDPRVKADLDRLQDDAAIEGCLARIEDLVRRLDDGGPFDDEDVEDIFPPGLVTPARAAAAPAAGVLASIPDDLTRFEDVESFGPVEEELSDGTYMDSGEMDPVAASEAEDIEGMVSSPVEVDDTDEGVGPRITDPDIESDRSAADHHEISQDMESVPEDGHRETARLPVDGGDDGKDHREHSGLAVLSEDGSSSGEGPAGDPAEDPRRIEQDADGQDDLSRMILESGDMGGPEGDDRDVPIAEDADRDSSAAPLMDDTFPDEGSEEESPSAGYTPPPPSPWPADPLEEMFGARGDDASEEVTDEDAEARSGWENGDLQETDHRALEAEEAGKQRAPGDGDMPTDTGRRSPFADYLDAVGGTAMAGASMMPAAQSRSGGASEPSDAVKMSASKGEDTAREEDVDAIMGRLLEDSDGSKTRDEDTRDAAVAPEGAGIEASGAAEKPEEGSGGASDPLPRDPAAPRRQRWVTPVALLMFFAVIGAGAYSFRDVPAVRDILVQIPGMDSLMPAGDLAVIPVPEPIDIPEGSEAGIPDPVLMGSIDPADPVEQGAVTQGPVNDPTAPAGSGLATQEQTEAPFDPGVSALERELQALRQMGMPVPEVRGGVPVDPLGNRMAAVEEDITNFRAELLEAAASIEASEERVLQAISAERESLLSAIAELRGAVEGQAVVMAEIGRIGESLEQTQIVLLDVSSRVSVLEGINPADRQAVNAALTDLSERIDGLNANVAMLARMQVDGALAVSGMGGEVADHGVRTAPRRPAGGDAVFSRDGEEPFRITNRPSSRIPSDVARGDMVEGYGEVLDIVPTEGGGRLVVMENGSVLISGN